MPDQLPHVSYLLAAKSFILDSSVYHFTVRELLNIESSMGDVAGDISMGQAAIAYHKNIVADSSVANNNIKHQDLYQAEAESTKAKAKYGVLVKHLEDLSKAKLIMETVLAQCEVLPLFKNEGITQIYEMIMYNHANAIKTQPLKELPFYGTTVLPRNNNLTQDSIERLLMMTAETEVHIIERSK